MKKLVIGTIGNLCYQPSNYQPEDYIVGVDTATKPDEAVAVVAHTDSKGKIIIVGTGQPDDIEFMDAVQKLGKNSYSIVEFTERLVEMKTKEVEELQKILIDTYKPLNEFKSGRERRTERRKKERKNNRR